MAAVGLRTTLWVLAGACIVTLVLAVVSASSHGPPPSEQRLKAIATGAVGQRYDAVLAQLQAEARSLFAQDPGGFYWTLGGEPPTPSFRKDVLVYRVGNDMAVEMPKGDRFYVALGVDDTNVVRHVSWDTVAPAALRAKTLVSIVHLAM